MLGQLQSRSQRLCVASPYMRASRAFFRACLVLACLRAYVGPPDHSRLPYVKKQTLACARVVPVYCTVICTVVCTVVCTDNVSVDVAVIVSVLYDDG